ncbi:MAG: GTP-binding protein, partial [Pseudomonadota bacterium]
MGNSTFTPENIRNIAVVGHSHSGKTALGEAFLFDGGATPRLGRAGDATSSLDTEPEEIRRQGSILSHFGWVEHAGKKINFIDTPGDANFFWDGLTALRGADGVVAVVSAVDGVRLQTRRGWSAAVDANLPRIILINQMDRSAKKGADVALDVAGALHVEALPVQLPIGAGEAFVGVVDLLARKAYKWAPDASGKKTEMPIPPEMASEVETAVAQMTEAIVSTDDELLEKYLETNDVSLEVLKSTFLKALSLNQLTPLMYASAVKNIGVQPVLDLVAEGFPSPIDRAPVQCKDPQGNEVTCPPKPNEPFLAQVIHTVIDEHLGQISIFRVFAGTLGDDGQILNVASTERLKFGTPYAVRGRIFEKTDKVVCGDIVAGIKLRNVHTSSTITDTAHPRTLPGMAYPKPMISFALTPETKKDEDKMKESLDRLIEEDPTLSYSHDETSHKIVLHGLGHGHLDIATERLNRKYKVSVKTDLPPIPYKETLAGKKLYIEGKHKKQTGGAGQFGVCFIDVEPLPRGTGFEFVDAIKGGAIPRQFIPSVEKGVVERAKHGLLAGSPVIDFRV